jgi:hypothetical protein
VDKPSRPRETSPTTVGRPSRGREASSRVLYLTSI